MIRDYEWLRDKKRAIKDRARSDGTNPNDWAVCVECGNIISWHSDCYCSRDE